MTEMTLTSFTVTTIMIVFVAPAFLILLGWGFRDFEGYPGWDSKNDQLSFLGIMWAVIIFDGIIVYFVWIILWYYNVVHLPKYDPEPKQPELTSQELKHLRKLMNENHGR